MEPQQDIGMSSVYGLTTIHDLPIELLVHVFLDVSSYDVANIAENPEKLSHAPPVVLSHVCSRWRAIALDTPRLWTLVVLSQAACRSGLLPAFSRRRGEGSPVHLIYCPNPVYTTASGEMVVMHSLLSDVSYRRIRTLIARYAWGASIEMLLQQLEDAADAFRMGLETLELTITWHDSLSHNGRLPYIRRLQTRYPPLSSRLAYLRLTCVPVRALSSWMYSNLRRLELSGNTYAYDLLDVVSAVRCAGKLDSLIMQGIVFTDAHCDSQDFPPQTTARHDHLRYMAWTRALLADIQDFMICFALPALEHLILNPANDPANETSFSPFHTTVLFPSVRRLSLACHGEVAWYTVARSFQFPQLNNLEISSSSCPVPRLHLVFNDPASLPVTRAAFYGGDVYAHNAGDVLRYLPHLEFLKVKGIRDAGLLLEPLKTHDDEPNTDAGDIILRHTPAVCPCLKDIKLAKCPDITNDFVLDIVRTRNAQPVVDNVQPGEETVADSTIEVQPPWSRRKSASGIEMVRMARRSSRSRSSHDSTTVGAVSDAATDTSLQSHPAAPHFNALQAVRITRCAKITPDIQASLLQLGVTDIDYTPSETDQHS